MYFHLLFSRKISSHQSLRSGMTKYGSLSKFKNICFCPAINRTWCGLGTVGDVDSHGFLTYNSNDSVCSDNDLILACTAYFVIWMSVQNQLGCRAQSCFLLVALDAPLWDWGHESPVPGAQHHCRGDWALHSSDEVFNTSKRNRPWWPVCTFAEIRATTLHSALSKINRNTYTNKNK